MKIQHDPIRVFGVPAYLRGVPNTVYFGAYNLTPTGVSSVR